MMLIETRSYVKVVGFEIQNNVGVNDGSGVRILGAGSHLEIRDNTIHDMRGQNAMGITVYATEPTAISDLVIDGNEIYDCEPATERGAHAERQRQRLRRQRQLSCTTSTTSASIASAARRDIQPDTTKVCARTASCRGNSVERARSSNGGGFAAGIYSDGGKNIVDREQRRIEMRHGHGGRRREQRYQRARHIVRNNVIIRQREGAASASVATPRSVGRVNDSKFTGNTLLQERYARRRFRRALDPVRSRTTSSRSNIFYATRPEHA